MCHLSTFLSLVAYVAMLGMALVLSSKRGHVSTGTLAICVVIPPVGMILAIAKKRRASAHLPSWAGVYVLVMASIVGLLSIMCDFF